MSEFIVFIPGFYPCSDRRTRIPASVRIAEAIPRTATLAAAAGYGCPQTAMMKVFAVDVGTVPYHVLQDCICGIDTGRQGLN